MSSAKNLATCNLKDCVKISGSSFRWGFIWDIPLLSWRLLGETLDEVSMKNLVLPAPDVLFDLLTFPRGQSSRSIMDWSQGRTCRPNPGELGYVTLWQERDGPGMEEKGALRGPDHQTTCALCTDTSDTSYTPPKMKPVPRPTTPASATMCQWRIWRMMSTSSMFRWGAVVLCCFVLLQTSNPAKAASCNSVLASIKSIILIPSYPSYSSPFWEGVLWSILTCPSRKPLKSNWEVWLFTFH